MRAASSGTSTTTCGGRRRTTRCACCSCCTPDASRRAMADPELARDLRPRRSRGRMRRMRIAQTWCESQLPRPAGQVDRLLLRRVRAASVAADLRGRTRRARRRSLQGSQRPWRAAHRRRLHVSAGLLPSEPHVRRLAAGDLREAELDDRRRSNRRSPATASRASPRCRSAIARCSSRCGACASAASRSICSTPISKRTRRGIANCPPVSTAAIARRASSRRSSSASAACAR